MVAADGEESVELFRSNHQEIDRIVMDVVMPLLSGPEAYLEMCAVQPDPKVIFTTGYTPKAKDLAAMVEKGPSILRKPYSLISLSDSRGLGVGRCRGAVGLGQRRTPSGARIAAVSSLPASTVQRSTGSRVHPTYREAMFRRRASRRETAECRTSRPAWSARVRAVRGISAGPACN